ncbi:MAG: dihydrolipoamide acetyltransferase family protein [Gammaproteobacteria bacterium]|nr:dihydrolipoamide acetyltransferase family protein [Gammaproteobacteria bacterium]
MPTEIYLVKVGMTMHEGTVEEWYVADGERVEAGAMLYRLETEKVNLDVDAEASGIVRHLAAEGDTLEPGDVVGFIYADGETIPDVLPRPQPKRDIAVVGEEPSARGSARGLPSQEESSAPPLQAKPAASKTRVAASPAARRLARERGVSLEGVAGSGPGGRIVEGDVPAAPPASEPPKRIAASPAARKLAAELNVDLANVDGSGPRGRITREDVQSAADAPATAQPSAGTATRMSAMRRTIAERMHSSLRDTAQLTMDMEVDVTDLVKLRGNLIDEWADDGVRVTYTDLVLVAAARALIRHPKMNACLSDDAITTYDYAHVGMAVALDEGLIVPVIRDAHEKPLREVARESADLAARARAGSLGLGDLTDGTFTVTSLGMFGVDTFTPILNPPQAGILGVGRIYDGVKWHDGTPVRTPMLRLSLTWDHRVLDGAPAAEFLAGVREYLEQPYRLLV